MITKLENELEELNQQTKGQPAMKPATATQMIKSSKSNYISPDERVNVFRTYSSAAPAPWVIQSEGNPVEHFQTLREAKARAQQIADAYDTPATARQSQSAFEVEEARNRNAERRLCECGHSEHDAEFGTCFNYPECDCETFSAAKQTEATARPWRTSQVANGDIDATCISPETGRFRLALLESDNHAADAAHIVRCVNSHDALTVALRAAQTALYSAPTSLLPNGKLFMERRQTVNNQINAALAAAEPSDSGSEVGR